MNELWATGEVLAALLCSAGIAVFVQRFLSDAHKDRETRELSQAVIGLLVTLAALVLGLLTSSVVESFGRAERDVGAYATDLIQIDRLLRQFGPEAEPVRGLLRSYVADAIATTWPSEPAPAGATDPGVSRPAALPYLKLESEALGAVLDRAEGEIRNLVTGNPERNRLMTNALQQFERLSQDRWRLIEEAHSSIPVPFYRVLVFWLMIVFATLGLTAPRNALALALVALAAVAIASVVFAIIEMDSAFGGLITVSSAPLRDALAHLSEPGGLRGP